MVGDRQGAGAQARATQLIFDALALREGNAEDLKPVLARVNDILSDQSLIAPPRLVVRPSKRKNGAAANPPALGGLYRWNIIGFDW